MTTFESAVTQAESDLVHVQSALDAAQHVLEAAGQVHRKGRRLLKSILKSIRIVVIVLVVGGLTVSAVMILDRLLHRFGRGDGDEATEAARIDQIHNMEQP
jgi:hypothetical protein